MLKLQTTEKLQNTNACIFNLIDIEILIIFILVIFCVCTKDTALNLILITFMWKKHIQIKQYYMEINCGYKYVYCKLKQIFLGFTLLSDVKTMLLYDITCIYLFIAQN